MTQPLQPSIQTFKKFIEGGYVYVDKTQHIYKLVQEKDGIYFLSRPRRFGKSLLISTLQEIFLGNKALFQNLWIGESDYQWETYPVIRLDFSANPVESAEELKQVIDYETQRIAQKYDLTEPLSGFDYKSRFQNLIRQLAQTNPHDEIVVLIDEYDKPLIDNLDNIEEAKRIQKVMKAFYATFKALDHHMRFLFITGVSKFTRVSIFSELNNLTDLTMQTSFAAALGITEAELRHYLADHIQLFAEQEGMTSEALIDQIREWYNGFCFAANGEHVYNPFSTMQLFYARQFSNYWFDSGTPGFLVKLMKERQYDLTSLKGMKLRDVAFSTYDIESLALPPLLYQTGYLTIKDYDPDSRRYTLAHPNQEVEDAFLVWLIGEYSYVDRGLGESYVWELIEALEEDNLEQMFKVLGVFFANIPYDLHVKHEKYYHTIFYILFMMIGYRAVAEVQTNDGRIDAVVEVADRIYIFEFKLDKDADTALTQIENHKYYQKYQLREKPITLVGANFNSKTRTVDDWKPREMTG